MAPKRARPSQMESSGEESEERGAQDSPATASTGTGNATEHQPVTFMDLELNEQTDVKLLLQALNLQKGKTSELEASIKQMRREMADRDNQDVPSARRRPSKKGRGKRRRLESTPAEDGDHSQHASDGDSSSSDATHSAVVSELEKAGRKMFVTCAPWFPKNLLEAVPDADFAIGDRFESEEQKREGLLHDALACIPDHLRDKVYQRQSLRTAFMYGLDTLRRGTRTRLRTEIDSAIVVLVSDQVDGTLTTADFGKPKKRFEKLRHLIGYKEEKETYDIWDVPVLHKNWEARMSMESREHLFLNRLPMTVRVVIDPGCTGVDGTEIYMAIIRGKSAARAFAEPDEETRIPPTDCQDKIFGLDHVSAGSIATCAMLARWVLSSDENLQKVGQRTKINYMDVYEEYLEKLVIGRERKQKSILNVFRTWDAEFFPYSSRSAGAANRPDRGEVAEQSRRVADILAADDEESQGVVDPDGNEQDAQDGE